jgi:hypothetical protein
MAKKRESDQSYPLVKSGAWISPIKTGYRMECCDCGLVHRIDFRHIPHGCGRKIQLRAFRDEEATITRRKVRET